MEQVWISSVFALFGVLIGIIGNWIGISIQGYINNRSQIELERLKLFQSDLFRAYNDLYRFGRFANKFIPFSDERKEYIALIKSIYFNKVMENFLFYDDEI
ncbi:MAG: hypothetical protein Q7O12_07610 [Deltaproteobacteria bacterium]|nr:hypothetical protein [Deltaproteobacteria bacterium]